MGLLKQISVSFNRLMARLEETAGRMETLTGELREANAERHRAEESLFALKKAVDIMQLGVTIADVTGKIIYTNSADARMHGYEVEELIGRDARLFAPPELHRENSLEDIQAMKSWSRDGVNIRKDGKVFPVRVTSDAVLDAAGRGVGVVTTCEDISERKRLEEELRKLNGELERKVEERSRELLEAQEELVRKEKLSMLGQLAGTVGHELRNPLGVMSNAVYFLKMVLTDADETTREYLDIVKKEIETSQRIITDLLDFARTRIPRTEAMTVRELVAESLERCAIPENVAIQAELPDSLPPLMADPLQMRQVLQNLIINAVQAMPEGGALRISARLMRNAECGMRNKDKDSALDTPHSALDADFVEISVADTGEGIATENLKKLFHPLFTTKPTGIGLGLTVCRSLVEANSGTIGVESLAGAGTTFTILLPAASF
ncbi:MAG: PAS domain S-box protein [Geobacteraceae bacterium]|nr:PAS domain S-box protein [Geobacteraceae bacterium]